MSFTETTTSFYGDLRTGARHTGVAIGDMDALIAAIATEHGFAIATRHPSPFERVGITVIDPFSG